MSKTPLFETENNFLDEQQYSIFIKSEDNLEQLLFRFVALCLVLASLSNIACSTSAINSIENSPKGILPSPSKSFMAEGDRLIKETGWQIPSIKDTRIEEQAIKTIKSVDGNPIQVKTSYFTPLNKTVYTEEAPSGTVTRVHGQLELIHFQEFKVKKKIYLYEITAQKHLDKSQTNSNSIHEEIFIYQLLDEDGDGKFETLINKRSDVLVPKWAAK